MDEMRLIGARFRALEIMALELLTHMPSEIEATINARLADIVTMGALDPEGANESPDTLLALERLVKRSAPAALETTVDGTYSEEPEMADAIVALRTVIRLMLLELPPFARDSIMADIHAELDAAAPAGAEQFRWALSQMP